MVDLKPISQAGIPAALEKAERYRFLNEPRETESICRDVLRADPDNQAAIVLLLLALTDQFGKGLRVNANHARELVPRLHDEYQRSYYGGVIAERWAKAQLHEDAPGYVVYDWLIDAMTLYEKAETLAVDGNEDAKLRWNACARIIRRNDQIRPKPQDQSVEQAFQDDVPVV